MQRVSGAAAIEATREITKRYGVTKEYATKREAAAAFEKAKAARKQARFLRDCQIRAEMVCGLRPVDSRMFR